MLFVLPALSTIGVHIHRGVEIGLDAGAVRIFLAEIAELSGIIVSTPYPSSHSLAMFA